MKKSIRIMAASAVVAGGLALAMVGATLAADEPANVIKYRQAVMGSNGTHITAIFAVLKGEVSFSDHIAAHAAAMHGMSKLIPDMFPPGSGEGETRAKPEIWQDWAKFEAASKALQTTTAKLVEAAESGDMAAIGAAAGAVGDACGGCHKPFRKPK